eukprot:jgi/Mesen1/2222/ME000152S01312
MAAQSLLCAQGLSYEAFLSTERASLGFCSTSQSTGSSGVSFSSSAFHNGSYQRLGRLTSKVNSTSRRGEVVSEVVDSGGDFQRKVGQAAEDAKRKASDFARGTQKRAVNYIKDYDLETKARKAAKEAVEKYEEFTFDMQRRAANFDRSYRVSEKAKQGAKAAAEKAEDVDQKFGVRQKVRALVTDLRLKWPKFSKETRKFFATPIGQGVLLVVVAWLLLSGTFFQIFFWSLWIIPLAPVILKSFVRAALVEMHHLCRAQFSPSPCVHCTLGPGAP